MAIQIGDKAPEILGTDQNGKEIRLSDFKGRKLALYFYPKDNTSGCTAEACSLRDGYEELRAAGYEVVGVSREIASGLYRKARTAVRPYCGHRHGTAAAIRGVG